MHKLNEDWLHIQSQNFSLKLNPPKGVDMPISFPSLPPKPNTLAPIVPAPASTPNQENIYDMHN